MNRLAIGFALTTVVSLALGATSLYLLDRLHDEQLRAQTELVSRQSAEARYRQLEDRYRELSRQREESPAPAPAAIVSSPSPVTNARTDSTASAKKADEAMRQGVSRRAALLDTPQGRSVIRLQLKASSKEMYSVLLKKLNLSPEQADAFLELLVDQREKEARLWRSMPDRAARAAARQNLQAATQSEVAQLLGAQKGQQFADYQATLMERIQVNQYASRLDAANLPMKDDQKEKFIAAMAEEKAALPEPEMTMMNDPQSAQERLEWQESFMNRTLDRASSILSADQLRILRDMEELQLTMQRQAAERMSRRRQGVAGDDRRTR